MFFPDVGLAPLLLALQALGTLDARLSPRVTGSTPSHPYCDTYAPAERRAHQCMAEQVSARCTHCMSPRRRSKASSGCRKRRRREACTRCSLCSAVLPRSTVHSFEGQVCGGVAGGHGLSAVAAQSRWQDRGLSSSPPVTTPHVPVRHHHDGVALRFMPSEPNWHSGDKRILFKTADAQFLNAQNKRGALAISPA